MTLLLRLNFHPPGDKENKPINLSLVFTVVYVGPLTNQSRYPSLLPFVVKHEELFFLS